jgi:hypothetical protein
MTVHLTFRGQDLNFACINRYATLGLWPLVCHIGNVEYQNPFQVVLHSAVNSELFPTRGRVRFGL